VIGASGTYSIVWKGPGTLNNSSLTQDNLKPGTYSLTVEDELGCKASKSFRVEKKGAPTVTVKSSGVSSEEDDDDDEDDKSENDDDEGEDDDEDGDDYDDEERRKEKASISLKVSGVNVKSVFWLGPEGVLSSTKTRLKNLTSGPYTYVVFGSNGCSTVGSVEIR
jgi:hypothetical protein